MEYDDNKIEEVGQQINDLTNQYNQISQTPASGYDELLSGIESHKKSMETPEQVQKRQRDMRNAAMWSSVTEGIGNIFQLTHAATNQNAVPMQAPSVTTSQAVQQAADKADARYEQQKDKLMQLQQQMAGLSLQQRQQQMSSLQNQIAGLRDDRKTMYGRQDVAWNKQNTLDQQAQHKVEADRNYQLQLDNMAENIRHNKQSESLSWASHNESKRHNTESERISQQNADSERIRAQHAGQDTNQISTIDPGGGNPKLAVPAGGIDQIVKDLPEEQKKQFDKLLKAKTKSRKGSATSTEQDKKDRRDALEQVLRENAEACKGVIDKYKSSSATIGW